MQMLSIANKCIKYDFCKYIIKLNSNSLFIDNLTYRKTSNYSYCTTSTMIPTNNTSNRIIWIDLEVIIKQLMKVEHSVCSVGEAYVSYYYE